MVDLVAGSELFELIERHGALPEPMVRHLVRQLLGALAALHGLGICHRDIKCENAMVRVRVAGRGSGRGRGKGRGRGRNAIATSSVRTRW